MKAACLALLFAACASSAGPAPERTSKTIAPASADAAGSTRLADATDTTLAAGAAGRASVGADAAGAPAVREQVASRAAAAASPALVSLPELPAGSFSTSIGSPTNGRVLGSVALPEAGPGFRFNSRRDAVARYGTVEVIGSIERAAAAVIARFPDSELVVNDIGLAEGGRIAHHGSHRAGRDADLLFFLRGDDGAPTPSVGAPIDPDGIGFDYKELSDPADDVRVHFDAQRTWRFVAALLEDREARVQRIFVVEHLRSALLAAARRDQAEAGTIALFEDVTCQPSYPHDDHLHVRWFCTLEDLTHGCQDLPPLYPWRAAELAAAGLSPVLAGRTRSSDPAPITTQAEAAREVKRQRPHKDVLAFLARRKSWEKQPHPGRPFCP